MATPTLLSTMMDEPLVLDAIIERAGSLFGTREVVSRLADRSLRRDTWADLARRARALAAGLARAGLREGDRVATLMWNHHAHVETYFGVPMAGGVYHTLNLRLPPEELAFIIGHARDRFLIVDDVLLPLLARVPGILAADGGPIERIFVVSLTGAPPAQHEPYEALLEGGDAGFSPPPRDERRAAGLCYTSGTTGRPKGVLYSHRALVLHCMASAMVDTLAIRHADVMLPVVPMFHVNAWGLPFTAAMVGAKLVLPGPHLDPVGLLDLYASEKVTFSAGVPTIWLGILQELERDASRWQLQPAMRMVVGGSACPESLMRGLDRFGLRVVHAWGMTETTPLGTVSFMKSSMEGASEDETYRIRAKQGLPVPFVDVRAIAETGPVPHDGVSMGELEVRGPWVAARYYENDESADRWTADGWFRTGDVVTICPDGYVAIADRTKDLVKSGGEWISSVALENALMAHPAVREACVVAIPDAKWGERPAAAIVWKEGARATMEDLRAHLAPSFAKWALPEVFVEVDAVPRNATGKFLKSKLRDDLKDPAQRRLIA